MMDVKLYGGKGAALHAAWCFGLPVPRPMLIPISSSRSGTECDEIRRKLRAPYVVRSSAPEEDGARASCAGLFESVINVPADGLEEAVRKVDLSAERATAQRYRTAMGIAASQSMAIVAQEFIDADVSGVMLDDGATVFIEAVEGLGEAICQGLVDPDSYLFDREAAVHRETRVGSQPFCIKGRAGGGTEQVPVAPRTELLLGYAEIYDLSFLSSRCRQVFPEWPRLNIEWCMRDGKIYILQVRSSV